MVVILKDNADKKKVKNLTDWLENQALPSTRSSDNSRPS